MSSLAWGEGTQVNIQNITPKHLWDKPESRVQSLSQLQLVERANSFFKQPIADGIKDLYQIGVCAAPNVDVCAVIPLSSVLLFLQRHLLLEELERKITDFIFIYVQFSLDPVDPYCSNEIVHQYNKQVSHLLVVLMYYFYFISESSGN